MSIPNTTSISSVANSAVGGSHRSPPTSTTPERALENITAADRPFGTSLTEWHRLSSVEQLGAAHGVKTPEIQFARADIVGSTVRIRPESDIRSDLPKFDIPNNVGAKGFSPGITTHDYIVTNEAPFALQGPAGLAAVGRALVANPTPGVDAVSTPTGTRNNVGGLVWGDGGTNFVKSYVIPSSDPKRSDAVVNYTIAGEHTMSEGFVMRFAELRPNGRIELVTYGEGNALKQTEALSLIWEPIVKDVWTKNAQQIFANAQAAVTR